jgi:hypothetical protein
MSLSQHDVCKQMCTCPSQDECLFIHKLERGRGGGGSVLSHENDRIIHEDLIVILRVMEQRSLGG